MKPKGIEVGSICLDPLPPRQLPACGLSSRASTHPRTVSPACVSTQPTSPAAPPTEGGSLVAGSALRSMSTNSAENTDRENANLWHRYGYGRESSLVKGPAACARYYNSTEQVQLRSTDRASGSPALQ